MTPRPPSRRTACSARSSRATSRPRWCTRPTTTLAFRDIDPQAPTHVLVIPRSHYPNAAALAAGEPGPLADLVDAAGAVAEQEGARRGLPPGLQHRRRGRPDRLPRPPARPRRPCHDLAARMSRPRLAARSPPRPVADQLRPRCRRPGRPAGAAVRHATPEPRPSRGHDRRRRRATRRTATTARGRPRRSATAAPPGRAPRRPADAGGVHPVGARRASAPTTTAASCSTRSSTKDQFITGFNVLPGNPDVVHHVILFRVPPDQVAEAEARTPTTPGQGWTCFGDSGLARPGAELDDAPWLGAWAPGGKEQVYASGVGEPPAAPGPASSCRSTTTCSPAPSPDRQRRRAAARSRHRRPHAAAHDADAGARSSCRAARTTPTARCATAEGRGRRRQGSGSATARARPPTCCTSCAAPIRAGPVQRAPHRHRARDHPRRGRPHAPARPRRSRSRSTRARPRAHAPRHPGLGLRQPGRRPIGPVEAGPGDTVKVTCRHSQELRDRAPGLRRPARASTSSGARAPPTRCAWASCWSPAPDRRRPARAEAKVAPAPCVGATRSMETRASTEDAPRPAGRQASPAAPDDTDTPSTRSSCPAASTWSPCSARRRAPRA